VFQYVVGIIPQTILNGSHDWPEGNLISLKRLLEGLAFQAVVAIRRFKGNSTHNSHINRDDRQFISLTWEVAAIIYGSV